MSSNAIGAGEAAVMAFPQPAPTDRVTLKRAPWAQRAVVRGTAAMTHLATCDWSLPSEPCRAWSTNKAIAGTRAALWLGPDEWLLVDETTAAESTVSLLEILTAAVTTAECAIVDVTHRQIGVQVSGPDSEAALSMFVPLDVAELHFPVGMVTRTLFEKAEIVLWRRAAMMFHVEVARSFAPYVTTLLQAAQRELTAAAAN